MKKLALISSYCDSQEKIDVLIKNIKKIKEKNIDVLVISPFPLDVNVVKNMDYFFVTKDNPVYEWPKKGWNFWQQQMLGGKVVTISKTVSDYGWASLHQVKTLNNIGITLDYDYYYHLIYDLKITDTVLHYFNQEHDKLVFPSKRNETIWDVGLHFMIFNKQNLNIFNSYITEESYNSIPTEESVFDWLKKVVNLLPIKIATTPVEDEIYLYENEDIFDYSPSKKIKLFIEKNDLTYGDIKLFFYGITTEIPVKLQISNQMETIITQPQIVNLGFNKFNMKTVNLYIQDELFDLTETIKKVKHNTLDIL
jgi:hypothetical protein